MVANQVLIDEGRGTYFRYHTPRSARDDAARGTPL